MPTIYPMRAFRYSLNDGNNIQGLVTQPYDKISESMRQDYLSRHPHNIVRVIKNQNYREAANHLNDWIQQGALKQDAAPSFYLYEQTYEYEGETLSRIGFIGMISLEEENSAVKGHERVLEGPMQDRLELIRATEANEGLIFTLFSEPRQTVDGILRDFAANHRFIYEVVDEYQARHRLWQCSDTSVNQALQTVLKDLTLYIADGHHRFQTSRLYFQECLGQGWKPAAPESFDKRMVAFFNMESPGLKILPTHRAIRNLPKLDRDQLLSNLRQNFEVTEAAGEQELLASMRGEGIRMGLVFPGRFYLVQPMDRNREKPASSAVSSQLDVNVLHDGILNTLLGIGQEELASQKYVDYYRDRSEMLKRLDQGQYQAAFLLNPTRLEQVRDVSERGERMPQKSTDFYPKLLTGLVLMKMKIEKS